MKNLNEMSLKEKDELLRGIIREYQKAQLQLNILKEREFYPQIDFSRIKEQSPRYNGLENNLISYIERKDNLEALVHFVESVFNSLPEDVYRLLANEYLFPRHKEWWLEYYSRSTYYRLRRKVLDDVLFYLIR